MDQRALGSTGLTLSHLGLGTMTWGRDTDQADAQSMLREFLEAGGTFIDTAPGYCDGAAEEILGEAFSGGLAREDVIVATKAGVRTWRTDRALIDASRSSLLHSLDASLKRLQTDYVDLLIVQAPDPATPLAETALALELAVTSGRARYVGVSNYPAWQAASLHHHLARTGLACAEMEYSLLARGIEDEMLPAARALGFGVIGWSPLGRGVLTGKYRHATPADSRGASPHLRAFVQPHLTERAFGITEAVVRAADGLEAQPLEVALAWALASPLASAIIGPRTPHQLRPILASDLQIPGVVREALDDVSALAP